jgi:hypothetical protein
MPKVNGETVADAEFPSFVGTLATRTLDGASKTAFWCKIDANPKHPRGTWILPWSG